MSDKLKSQPVKDSIPAHSSVHIDISFIVKGRVCDPIIVIAVGTILAAPIMRPLPLALGGGGEESEKGGEEGKGDLCLFHIVGV